MKWQRLDSVFVLLFAASAAVGYQLWRSEGVRLWLSDVAKFCGF